jgi:hypothetical protein
MKGKGYEENEIEKIFKKKVKDYDKLLGKGGTYGKDLDDLGKKLYGSKWCGIWTQADMPWSKIKKSKCLYGIFNNDHSGPGEHWLAFYVKDSQFYIWDSYGRDIEDIVPVLEKKLKGQRIRYQMSDRDANQTKKQKNCGSRCFAWLSCVKEYGIRRAMKI